MKRESRARLIVAIVLLLLPVLYVGSYLALVVPNGRMEAWGDGGFHSNQFRMVHYRALNGCSGIF
jgi:hypothetical protein